MNVILSGPSTTDIFVVSESFRLQCSPEVDIATAGDSQCSPKVGIATAEDRQCSPKGDIATAEEFS